MPSAGPPAYAVSAPAGSSVPPHEAVVVEIGELDTPLACYVCLEDGPTEAGGELLRGVCGCTTTALHHGCVCELVNKMPARALSMPERTTCSVCRQEFRLTFGAHVVGGHSYPRNCREFLKTPAGSLFVQAAAVVTAACIIIVCGLFLPRVVTCASAQPQALRLA